MTSSTVLRQWTSPVPPFWTLFVSRYLGASSTLSRTLWRHYEDQADQAAV